MIISFALEKKEGIQLFVSGVQKSIRSRCLPCNKHLVPV